jgi:CheY-like chemotaxis protein
MKKILIVNAISVSLEREKSILDRADFRIFCASSAADALRIHRDEQVDVIVADLDVHDMTGDQLCSLIRKDNGLRTVSFIMVCHGTPKELERVTTCGANTWIEKPIRAEQLIQSVGQFLDVPLRRGYRVLLKVKADGAHDGLEFFGMSHNISVSGILIETEAVLAKGDNVTCSFFLPGSHQIMVSGNVVRIDKQKETVTQYGIRFSNLAAKCREEIEKFIDSHASKG